MFLPMQKALKLLNRYIWECPLRGIHRATKNLGAIVLANPLAQADLIWQTVPLKDENCTICDIPEK
jgi:hypothetical protein